MGGDASSTARVAPSPHVLDRVVHASLRPTLFFLTPLLAGFGAFHWFLLPPGAAGKMVVVAETSALACVLLLVSLHRGRVPVAWSHPVAAALAALLLANGLIHLALVKDPADTVNILLLIAGAGFVLLSTPWLTVFLTAAWVGWIGIALSQPSAIGWWPFTFALISATVLSAIVHTVRLRTVVRLEGLRLELEARVLARTSELSAANQQLVATNAALEVEITERRATEDVLANERNLLRTLLDNLPDAVYVKDIEGRYRAVNPACLHLHGLQAPEQLVGKTSAALSDNGFGQREEAEDRQLLQGGSLTNHETTYVAPSGETRHLLTSKCVVRDSSGAVVGLVGVSRDVTLARRQEETRKLMDRKLRDTQKLESLGVLAGGIAHDFNNLLTAILGNVSLLRIDAANPARGADYLAQIEAGAVRAADLCRQMLAYAGRGHFSVRVLDVNAIVQDSLPLLQMSISKKARLRLNLAPRIAAVSVDLTQLRQVLMNLVINASDAIGDSPGSIIVSSGVMRVTREYLTRTVSSADLAEGDYAFVEVSDDGCGMTRETITRMFDPFFTTKFTGRGLGLSVVLGIVRGHRGALTVYSEPGRGTTFKVLLPASTEPVEAIDPARAPEASWRGGGELLLIDDESAVREVTRTMLTELGFSVSTAADGVEGLAVFRATPDRFVAVLLDLTMPRMSGDEAFRELRRTRPDIRVLLMSGFNEQDAVIRFAGRGLTGFLQKPFTIDMLREHLRAVFAANDAAP